MIVLGVSGGTNIPTDASPCTCGGKITTKYHSPRYILVPALREELGVRIPEDRGPDWAWKPGPPVEAAPAAPVAKPIRIGLRQVLDCPVRCPRTGLETDLL
ncbi:hypothetical protein AB0I49_07080 [Streptomyces sp. NPDC050617]|uniref:hypothetical protein n=1 Tax=Streptomyces sp. NPDC050617 TaxID=3154628 RepID=UPI0034388D4E